MPDNITSSRPANEHDVRSFHFNGKTYTPGKGTFKTDLEGLTRLAHADRLFSRPRTPFATSATLDDYPAIPIANIWTDTGTGSFTDAKVYVVQTASKVIQRCLLMTTDPGDLVLDPTCGSGTTATVAAPPVDNCRYVTALALARARISVIRTTSLATRRTAERSRDSPSRAILPSRP